MPYQHPEDTVLSVLLRKITYWRIQLPFPAQGYLGTPPCWRGPSLKRPMKVVIGSGGPKGRRSNFRLSGPQTTFQEGSLAPAEEGLYRPLGSAWSGTHVGIRLMQFER
ncbi:hypothetical protein ACO22_04136 [Paracoccidioides brasiliensis]|uniref:Uncharacterized protein n=1 Tax=Paracoccidioides brasiliensis TaxID=121759 RepID=A0A1D2JE05_PARBR|nr:hypothetical protein ACO22_04136 [Paracoccidioides brasiliensis]